jgi:carbonic anhydrase
LSYTPDLVQGRLVGPDFVLYGDFGSITSLDDGYNEYFTAAVDKVVFKAPAEHEINSTVSSLEMQIYHRFVGAESQVLVLSVLYQITDTSSDFLSTVISSETVAQEVDLRLAFGWVQELFNYYMYSGSLTSPPCDENVIWFVWAEPRPISRQQAAFFNTIWQSDLNFAGGNGNDRELQNLNGRVVTRYQGIVSDVVATAAALATGFLILWTGV